MSILTEINRIKDAVTAIVNAIKGKGVTVPTTAKVDDLASLVSAIPTGTDTSDATATASHILKDKTAYVKGVKVTGNIVTYDGSNCQSRYSHETTTEYVFNADMSGKRFVNNTGVNAGVEKRDFGNATANLVYNGLTFTSEEGFCIEGTMQNYDGSNVDALSVSSDNDYMYIETPIGGMIVDDCVYTKIPIATFGDAEPRFVLEGFTFTSSDGVCIDGTMPSYGGDDVDGMVSYSDDNCVYIETPMEGKYVGDGVWSKIPLASFGDVSPDCVKAGECFTSDAGFWVEGTMPVYDYTPIEAFYEPTCDTDDDFAFLGYTVQSIVEDEVYLGVPKSHFGDAKASDVRKGKTFTSADGVCITGTYEAASVKTCTVNVTFSYNPRNYMISATTYANGAFSNSITRASTGASVSIPNVVCGSVLVLNGQNAFTPTWSASHTMGGDQNVCAATVPSNSGTYTLNIGVFDD